jgi:hypothetical protein
MAFTTPGRNTVPAVSGGVFRAAGRPNVISRAVYGTIVVTSVLVVYDGWTSLRLVDAIVTILGPVIAMVIGHIFAASLAAQASLGRRPTRGELLTTTGSESWFLLVAAPQIVLLLVLKLVGLSLDDSVQAVIWAGVALLGFWGGVAAKRAGLGGRGIALGIVMGFAVGGVVLILQVALQPGKEVPHGVAVTSLGYKSVA